MTSQIDVTQVVANSRLGPYQMLVLFMCFTCMTIDGFDIQSMAYVAPEIISQWGIAKASLGPVFGVSLVGMLLGSLIFGSIADAIGRRPVLIAAHLLLALTMFATTYAESITGLMVMRLLSGLAMGAIVPNAIAMATEFAPNRNKVTLLMLVSSGMVFGGIVGGVIAAWLIPLFGWHSVFYTGAIAPLVLALLMLALMPESMQWLTAKGKSAKRVAKTLNQIDPNLIIDDAHTIVMNSAKKSGLSVRGLLDAEHGRGTLLLWLMNLMNMLCVYFLASWIPVLMSDAGHAASESVLAGAALWLGGLGGTWLLGWCVDRKGYVVVLLPTFILAGLAIVFFSLCYAGIHWAYLFIAVAGFGTLGGQALLNTMASTYYPTALRSTGLGWALGFGRLGGIMGPIIGGGLLTLQWSTANLLMLSALPIGITVVAILIFSRTDDKRWSTEGPSSPTPGMTATSVGEQPEKRGAVR
ncbi:MFS transporter [Pseudomonas sp. X10]